MMSKEKGKWYETSEWRNEDWRWSACYFFCVSLVFRSNEVMLNMKAKKNIEPSIFISRSLISIRTKIISERLTKPHKKHARVRRITITHICCDDAIRKSRKENENRMTRERRKGKGFLFIAEVVEEESSINYVDKLERRTLRNFWLK